MGDAPRSADSLLVVVIGSSLWQEVWVLGAHGLIADIRAHHRAGWGGQGHAFEHVGVDHEERKAGARKAAAGHVLPLPAPGDAIGSQRHVVELVEREVEARLSGTGEVAILGRGPVGWPSDPAVQRGVGIVEHLVEHVESRRADARPAAPLKW